MKRFTSLGWKIFLSVWLTSLLVVLITAFVMGQIVEREKHQEVLVAKAMGFAEVLVERYEQTGSVKRQEPWRKKYYDRDRKDNGRDDGQEYKRESRDHDSRKHNQREREYLPYFKLRIYTEDKQQIAGPKRPVGEAKAGSMFLKLQSDTGSNYLVVVDVNPRKSLFWSVFKFMLSVQMVIIIVVSALASLLLTWIVIRPIKRLRQHTEDLYQGNYSVRTDTRLSARADEIGDLAREFNRMADHVEQALNANQRLLQDVSHELRAPLARLQMATGLVEQRLGEDDQNLVTRINLECERLSRLIDEILSLARLESQSGEAQLFELEPLLSSLVEDCRFIAPEHTLKWQEEGERSRLFGQAELLRRAVDNILGNAIKHTPAGSEISISVSQTGTRCRICIDDNGSGVDDAQLERLFDPFYRQQQVDNGYGLGLSIAKRAAELLGGRIEASSPPGKGLQVCIDLPLAKES
ncbi:sensor histidine kinase [Aliamphritea spongicola]|uniref:sensor histidine kinase n=1 Tax=Aliamphritea spongicola TaxID=707589 RepID=UPI00196AF722|nr:HAMP domain-containing sensor histidine kinase [Aliamphritea spongicola]MBN3564410.1 HAMP domain-containing histidine kinase [Aliamphritea spongicola]